MAMTMPARTIATAMIATMILLRGLRAPSCCSVVGGAPSDGPDWPANRPPPRGASQVRHITLCGSLGAVYSSRRNGGLTGKPHSDEQRGDHERDRRAKFH